jgi:CPA2 family monovalent cation:H+ antiporter-2
MVLGGLCVRFKQSSLVGYLLAGTLLGPNALDLLPNHEAIAAIAELGVALLLFTIGLEFSFARLRSVGRVAAGGGTVQVAVTGALTTALCLALGLGVPASVALGAMVALSSTAAVIRLLADRAEIESVHGRSAIGVLLLQDVAVVPLALLVAALSAGEGESTVVALLQASGLALGLIVVLRVVLNYVLPLLLSTRIAGGNRELSILMAVVTAVGAAWASHALGLSPVLGSFIAGLLLADSPYATQIRADVVPLRALFVTLFFSSIGMLVNPVWVAQNAALVLGVVVAIVVGKALVTAMAVRPFAVPTAQALATGVVLAQVGEFSLVLATIAQQGGVITTTTFDLVVAVLTATLFLTPYLVAGAPRLAHWVAQRSGSGAPVGPDEGAESLWSQHLVIVGFGPAGKRVAELEMGQRDLNMLVIDMSPGSLEQAQDYGLATIQGDATRPEILERAHVASALAVVVTIPDPFTARQIVMQVRSMAPNTKLIVRSRYHIHRWALELAGAHAVVDEENVVGVRIAEYIHQWLEERRGAEA